MTKYTNSESKYITVDGMRIHYKDEGQGPVVILIHGVCASLHTWDGWTGIMKDRFRIIRIDLPGFGFSELKDKDVFTRDSAVRLMELLVQEMKLQEFSIAGNSLGGYVAWLYALNHPDRVEKLVLVDPVGLPMKMPWLLRFASNPLIRPFSRHIMPRFIFSQAVNQVYGDKSRITQGVKDRYFELAMRENGKRDYVDIFTGMGREVKKPGFSAGISDIGVPTLVMWGTKDIWIDYNEFFPQWEKLLPRAKFISYEGAGHVPMEEIPVRTAEDAIKFLSE
jgi:pimeloyl-ACP methyl ester carboxylesterase